MDWERIHKWLDKYLAYIEDNYRDDPKQYKKFLEVLDDEINYFLRKSLL